MFRTALISFIDYSISIRSLSAYLRHNGFDVICMFCPEKFNAENIAALISHLVDENISLVGVSVVTDDYPSAVELTTAIKTHMKIPIIWGGAHPNVRPDECLQHADMICLGEGEEALLELVTHLSNGDEPRVDIRNICFKTSSGIIRNPLRPLEENLDRFPSPEIDTSTQFLMTDSGIEPYSEQYLRGEYGVMTSRGCPYNCNYCYNSYRRNQYLGKGRYLRFRSVENVIKELVSAKATFPGIRRVSFWDDSFISRKSEDLKRFRDLYYKSVELPFFALAEPMAFNKSKVKMLKDCGLDSLQVGIQTGSDRINREVFNRKITGRQILETANAIHELKLRVVYDLIFNNPYEEISDITDTIILLLKFPRPFRLQGYNLIFYPGAEITRRALSDGHISENHLPDEKETIEAKTNSPFGMKGKSKPSSRFYRIEYDSRGKEYLNTVLFLLNLRYLPVTLVRYFAKGESRFKKNMIALVVRMYAEAVKVKRALYNFR